MGPGYQALHQGAAWIELPGRGKIRTTGDDRARLLHAMTTNHIERLTPGAGCYAYFLSAQGRILADVNVICLPDALLLDTEPETRQKVFQHLDLYIIADDVTLTDATASTVTLALEGPSAAQVIDRLGISPLVEPYANVAWNDCLVAHISLSGAGGFLICVPRPAQDQVIAQMESAGAVPATIEDHEIVRIEHGKPRYGHDLSERFLAQEANQPDAVSFSKGCYLGQEIVERVRSRGQVHRLLMPIELEGTIVPDPGAKFTEGASAVAEITSAAYSPTRGKVVALAYIRADKAKPGAEIHAGDTTIRVNSPA